MLFDLGLSQWDATGTPMSALPTSSGGEEWGFGLLGDAWAGTSAQPQDIQVSDAFWLDPLLCSASPAVPLPRSAATADNTPSPEPFDDGTLPSPERCWELVLARSRAASTAFVYCVTSTKIYCRTTCPSRRPNRANVRFFLTGREAVDAGYRACLRCKPEEGMDPAERRQKDAVEKAMSVIRERVEHGGKIGLNELAKAVGVSAFHLHRCFKKQVGLSPEAFGKKIMTERSGPGTKRKSGKKLARGELSLVAEEVVDGAIADLL